MIGNINKRLEKTTCFSQSKLWSYITEFYLSQGPKAWDNQVPYLVTNSPIVAKHHAHLILKHAKGPYSIIDYGAGTGQHGYYLAKYLTELAPQYQKPIEWFSIYLAEISDSTLQSWKNNPDLSHYIQSSLITPLELSEDWINNVSKLPNTPQHCLIANYLFDSMPFIAFDQHKKMGLTLYAKRKHYQNPTLDQLVLKPQPLPHSSHPYPKLEKRYANKRYTIPYLGLDFIDQFFSQSQDALMIINDKMFLDIDSLDYDPLFNLTLEGCYSTTLNMDAILQTHSHLKTHITNHCERLQTVILSHKAITPETSLNCSDVASIFEYYKQVEALPARYCHSIAKSLSYEPFCLEIFSQSIIPDYTTKKQLLSLIELCQEHIFHNSHPFTYLHASKVLRRCSFYEEAMAQLEKYHAIYGEHPAYHLEKGILYYSWKKTDQASKYLKLALQNERTAPTANKLLEEIAS